MKSSLPVLTSLRFFAAAAIVIQHGVQYFKVGGYLSTHFVLIQAVTFFFVLSGFILTYNYPKLEDLNQTGYFIWSRIARIFPAHLAISIPLVLVFYYLHMPISLSQVVANLSLTQAWHPTAAYYFSLNAVSWSLSVELFFYLMFPLLIFELNKVWWRPLIISIALIVTAISICVHTDAPVYNGQSNIPTISSWIYIWPPTRLLEFVLGMYTAKLWIKYNHLLSHKIACTLLELLSIGFVAWGLGGFHRVLNSYTYGYVFSSPLHMWFAISSSTLFFCFFIFIFAKGQGLVSHLLRHRVFILLGEISFSLYLIHQPIARFFEMFGPYLFKISLPIQYMLYWVVVITASYLLWSIIEMPCQKALKNFYKMQWARSRSSRLSTGSGDI